MEDRLAQETTFRFADSEMVMDSGRCLWPPARILRLPDLRKPEAPTIPARFREGAVDRARRLTRSDRLFSQGNLP